MISFTSKYQDLYDFHISLSWIIKNYEKSVTLNAFCDQANFEYKRCTNFHLWKVKCKRVDQFQIHI
jgi:hypothetical protein